MHTVESAAVAGRHPLSSLPPSASREENQRLALAIREARSVAWTTVLAADPRVSPDVVRSACRKFFEWPRRVAVDLWSAACEAVARARKTTARLLDALKDAAAKLAAVLMGLDEDDKALGAALSDMRLWGRPEIVAVRGALARAVAAMERANLRFLMRQAKRRHVHARHLSLGDLVGYGAIGLRTAVLRFDPDRGTSFTTHAAHWIDHHMRRALSDLDREIRIPVFTGAMLSSLADAERRVIIAGGDARDAESVAALMKPYKPGRPVSAAYVEKIRKEYRPMAQDSISLSAPLRTREGGDMAYTLGEAIADDDAAMVDEDLAERQEHDARMSALRDALASLTDTERAVVEWRWNLGESERGPAQFAEIGEVLGVSRQRAKQIEERALGKIAARVRSAVGDGHAMLTT